MQHSTSLNKHANVKISALGCYTPPRLLTNPDLERMVGTTSQWIMERTGICRRHIADPGMATSDLAIQAAKAALASRGIDARGLDAVVACTVTPDTMFPSTACMVQEALGARRRLGFDLIAACCSFVYGLATAVRDLVAAGMYRKVLVIGADTMSRIIDYHGPRHLRAVRRWRRRHAARSRRCRRGRRLHRFPGRRWMVPAAACIALPAGGSRLPASQETIDKRRHYVQLQGQPAGLQVCRRKLSRDITFDVAGPQRLNADRPRCMDPAPGQPPHHVRGGRAHRAARRRR